MEGVHRLEVINEGGQERSQLVQGIMARLPFLPVLRAVVEMEELHLDGNEEAQVCAYVLTHCLTLTLRNTSEA